MYGEVEWPERQQAVQFAGTCCKQFPISNYSQCGPGLARRPTLETWLLGERAIRGGRERAHVGLTTTYPGTRQGNRENERGKSRR
jgi:hypothetical protein